MRIPAQAGPVGPAFFVSVDGEAPITWAEFCEANADAFTADELGAIGRDLQRDEVYRAGGGAVPDVEIRLVTLTAGVA